MRSSATTTPPCTNFNGIRHQISPLRASSFLPQSWEKIQTYENSDRNAHNTDFLDFYAQYPKSAPLHSKRCRRSALWLCLGLWSGRGAPCGSPVTIREKIGVLSQVTMQLKPWTPGREVPMDRKSTDTCETNERNKNKKQHTRTLTQSVRHTHTHTHPRAYACTHAHTVRCVFLSLSLTLTLTRVYIYIYAL